MHFLNYGILLECSGSQGSSEKPGPPHPHSPFSPLSPLSPLPPASWEQGLSLASVTCREAVWWSWLLESGPALHCFELGWAMLECACAVRRGRGPSAADRPKGERSDLSLPPVGLVELMRGIHVPQAACQRTDNSRDFLSSPLPSPPSPLFSSPLIYSPLPPSPLLSASHPTSPSLKLRLSMLISRRTGECIIDHASVLWDFFSRSDLNAMHRQGW